MSIWQFSPHRAAPRARILLDVGSASVAGGCALYFAARPPVFCYGTQAPIAPRVGEDPAAALARATALVLDGVEAEGLAALARIWPGVRLSEALCCFDAPWVETSMRVLEEHTPGGQPITVSNHFIEGMLRRAENAEDLPLGGRIEQLIVASRLNGYRTKDPVGKRARLVTLVMLRSSIAARAAETILDSLRERFQIREPRLASGAALRYRVVSDLFPYEQELLVVDGSGSVAVLALERAHTLVALKEYRAPGAPEEWARATADALEELAADHPLPQSIIFVENGDEHVLRKEALSARDLGALCSSRTQPRMLPLSSVMRSIATFAEDVPPDIRLGLHALACA